MKRPIVVLALIALVAALGSVAIAAPCDKAAETAKAEGAGCAKKADAAVAKAEGTGCAKKADAAVAKAEGCTKDSKDCCAKSGAAAVAKADGAGCAKDGAGCPKAAKAAQIAKADVKAADTVDAQQK